MPVSAENYENEIGEGGKNARTIKCSYCASVILSPTTANFTKNDFNLPLMKQNKTSAETETEPICAFWSVPDMYIFINIGFSNTVGTTKYLSCADCEAGPIGYHDLNTGMSYIALSRIKHC